MRTPQRTIAVDWSGAKETNSKQKIWLAEVQAGELRCLENGKSREEVRDRLIEIGRQEGDLVVGLDFAFSCPEWFVRECGCAKGPAFWSYVRRHGEEWLSDPPREPFFRKGKGRTKDRRNYRDTDWSLRAQGESPESVFKLVGARQVGFGSIRGMPILEDLRAAGFSIWPFDLPKLPLVVEIYPRLFYGREVKKSNLEDRVTYLKKYENLGEMQRIHAQCSDDAFDATVSAFAMFERRKDFTRLPAVGETEQIEGRIWS